MAYSRIRFEIQNSATMTLVHTLKLMIALSEHPEIASSRDALEKLFDV